MCMLHTVCQALCQRTLCIISFLQRETWGELPWEVELASLMRPS
jgi:hypothetical protein